MFFKKKMISSGIVIVLAAALIYSLCAAAAFHISAVNIVKFVLAQVFVIYLPGNAISHRLFKGEYSFINTIFLSYAVGYGISISLYGACIFNRRRRLLLLLFPLFAVWNYSAGKTAPPFPDKKQTGVFCLFSVYICCYASCFTREVMYRRWEM